MSFRSYTAALAAVATVVSLAGSSFGQSGVRLEESTGTVTRQPASDVIDIKIGSKPARPAVRIEEPGSPMPDPDEVENGAPHNSVRSGNASTTTSTADIEAPAGVPVPTVVSPEERETEPAVQPPPPPPSAVLPITAPAMQPEPVAAPSDDVDYLPPALLGKQPTIDRGGIPIPLRPEQLTSAPLDLTVPDVNATTLSTGMHLYHYESHDLPRVRVSLIIQAGQSLDPADKVGLAELTVRTLRAGGAAGKSGDEIDQQLEQIGSDLEFNVERDYVAGSMFALTDKADEAMALLADILLKPEFDEKKFAQQKARAMEELRRQNDQPDAISRREYRKIIYGPDHPLARTATSASLSSITRDDVRAFHDARFRPNTVWIGVSGDINLDGARKLVETAFGGWDRPAADPAPEITFDEARDTTGGVFFTPKATAQSQIRIGHVGIPRMSPQVYAVNILNSIYGTGGFSSRLMNQVRTKNGYVYGVGGGIMSDQPIGLFVAAAASKAGTTGAAIKEIMDVTKSVIEGPIPQEELETARRDVLFTFTGQFDTPSEIVNTHMLYDYRGYPQGYLKNFPDRIKAVSADDLKAAATQLLHPDRYKVYVIGNEAEMDMPVSTFGQVQEWKLESYGGDSAE